MADIMLDLETLGVLPNSVVLSLGAVEFDPHRLNKPTKWLYLAFDADSQIASGRSIDPDTLAWWEKQDPQVIEDAMSSEGRVPVKQALLELTQFVFHANDIWCQGPVFDIAMLEDLYRQYELHIPWRFWQIRDSRTLFKFLNHDPRKSLRGTTASHHNALDDAAIQAMAVQDCYRLLQQNNLGVPAK